jgi:hypothetical protein
MRQGLVFVQTWLGRVRTLVAQQAVRRRLRWAFGCASLLAVGYVLAAGLGRVDWASLSIDWRYLVLAWLATAATVGMGVLSWTVLTRAILPGISAAMLAHIHVRSLLAKYLPGGVWNSASKVVQLHQLGVPAKRASFVVALDLGLLALTGLEVLLVMANAFPAAVPISISPGLLLQLWLIVTAACVMSPLIVSRVSRKDRTTSGDLISGPPVSQLWLAEIVYMVNWLCLCVCFALVVAAVMPLDINRAATLSLATVLSFLIGLAVVVIPNGVGLRELSYSVLMSSIMPAAIALSLGFVFRLVIALAEVCVVMVTYGSEKLHNAWIRRQKRALTPMDY